ncbi:MAG: hypothetical protein EXS36_15675 [Pedosphaera sp.]|nr:hypothetical protein [Pedosphaera sp.]
MRFKLRGLLAFQSLLALLVVGSDLLLVPTQVWSALARVPSPLPREVGSLVCFGLFSNNSSNNMEFTLWGRPLGTGTNFSEWRQLPSDEFFPFSRGLQYNMMRAEVWGVNSSGQNQSEVHQALGNRVRHRHNVLHPDAPVTQIAYRHMAWPARAVGFHAGTNSPDAVVRYFVLTDVQ